MTDGALGGAASEPESSLLRALVDNLPEMVAYWDANQRCRFANRAYEKWFGVRPEALIGCELRQLLGPLYALNLPYIEGALRGEEQQFERDIADPHGGPTRSGLAHYVPDVVAGKVQGFCVLVADITQRKRAEAAKLALERQSRETERLAGMAALAASVGHELNNPLAILMANLEQLLRSARDEENESSEEMLAAALAAASRMRDIVGGMTLQSKAASEADPVARDRAVMWSIPQASFATEMPRAAPRRRLLIIDDEPAITAVLERALGDIFDVTSVNRSPGRARPDRSRVRRRSLRCHDARNERAGSPRCRL